MTGPSFTMVWVGMALLSIGVAVIVMLAVQRSSTLRTDTTITIPFPATFTE